MNIIILCDQTDCMHNDKCHHDANTRQGVCTFDHPVFYKYRYTRHCTSKCVKHVKLDKTKEDETHI